MNAIKTGLSRIWSAWKAFGKFMGDIIGRVFLMIFYLTVALPFGIGVRLFGDPLDIKNKMKGASWIERKGHEPSIETSGNQF